MANKIRSNIYLAMILTAASLASPVHAQVKNKYVSCSGFLGMGDNNNSLAYSTSGDSLCEDAELSPQLLEKVLKICGFEHCQIRGTISGRGAFEWYRIYSVKRLPPPKKDGGD